MKPYWPNKTCLQLFFLFFYSLSYSQTGTLRGIVKDQENILQSATVVIDNKYMLTNVNGEFSISLNSGLYTVNITYAGYKKLIQDIVIELGKDQLIIFNIIRDESLEEVVMLGSRSSVYRSNMSTPVPVDAVYTRNLVKNQIELSQMVAAIIPSYNSPTQVNGPAANSLPATLHGLAPDQTLVLLNGRRLHSSSFIYPVLAMGRGTVGSDINTISQNAIEKIEILRDGASAQYGSDAIAGVIDLQLKQFTGKTLVSLHTGQYYKGDGETMNLAIHYGMALHRKSMPAGRHGFLNLAATLDWRNDALRSEGFYTGTVYKNYPLNATIDDSIIIKSQDDSIISARGFDKKSHWRNGLPQMKNTAFLVNGDYPVSKNARLFWVASFDRRQTETDANNYRYPKDTSLVITELYPDGFRATGIQNTWDVACIGGIEGSTSSGWNWNGSVTYGGNWWNIDVDNSNNASQYHLLRKNAQTSFDCGTTVFQQNTNNINFTRQFMNPAKQVKLFSVGTGIEFRIENYQIRAGEEASYKNYSPASDKVGGSQVLIGYSLENVVNRNRYVGSGYINLEAERNESLLLNLSGRYEYYNDFGGNLAGKLAIRYKFSDRFMIRGSVSNGFRAPSLQQRYYSLVTQPSTPGISSRPYKQYTFRNESKIAEDFGIPSLNAEKSLNLNAGITWKLTKQVNLIADAYWIQIRDRIVLSGFFSRKNNTVVNQILSQYLYNDIFSVAFFTNAINTKTRGIDIAFKGKWKINKSMLEILLSANFNHTGLYGEIKKAGKLPDDSVNANQLINREERGKIEKAQPANKIILLLNYNVGKWGIVVNNTLYGKVSRYFNGNDLTLDEVFSSKIVTDLSAFYTISKWFTISAGARNLFNVYPDRIKKPENTMEGRWVYSNNVTQFGYMGGYYFMNMSLTF